MQTIQPIVQTRAFHRGLERWDRWLQERLAPALVTLTDTVHAMERECRWTVRFAQGGHSELRIPRPLVEASLEDFHRVTTGLESYGWQAALERAGVEGLRLECRDAS